MSTTFIADLEVAKIHAHPKNPRHAAAADDDMVASIREAGLLQPVVVAPHPDKAGHYVLIAGHRRRDGSIKAKLKKVPAMLRTDLVTEGQQIEAMIVENGHRLDLTPIEEAEGYAQLELLGYKQAAIAAAVGRNVKTIRSRLGLLKLSKSTQGKVHEGQLTLEDALAIGEFSDDKDTTKALEKAATGGNLRYELQNARYRRDRIRAAADKVAALTELGAKPYQLPKGTPLWQLSQDGVVRGVYDETEYAKHKGCLAYVEGATPSGVDRVDVICTKPSKHAAAEDKEAAAERAQREAEREAAEQARTEKADQQRAATAARTSTLLDLVGTNTKIAPQLRDLIRALVPYLLMHPECEDALRAYQDAVEIPTEDRWTTYWWGDTAAKNRTLASQHLAELATMSDGRLVRGLVGALVGMAETYLDTFDAQEKIDLQLVGSYYDVLSEAGYVNSPPDVEIQDQLRDAWAAIEDTDEPEAAAS